MNEASNRNVYTMLKSVSITMEISIWPKSLLMRHTLPDGICVKKFQKRTPDICVPEHQKH